MLPLLCSMSLISQYFDVKLIIFFPILARGLFPKIARKSPDLYISKMEVMIAILKFFEMASPETYVGLNENILGGIRATWSLTVVMLNIFMYYTPLQFLSC